MRIATVYAIEIRLSIHVCVCGGGSLRCRMETESLINLSPSVQCTRRHLPRGKMCEPEANPRLTLKRKICGVFLQFSTRFRVVIFMSNSKFTLHERKKYEHEGLDSRDSV